MGLRPFFPPASAALALALGLATGAGACHDVGLYPLQARAADAGSEPVDVGSEPVDVGSPTEAGLSDAPVDMPVMPPPCANLPVIGYATLTAAVDGGPPQVGTTGGGNLNPQVVTKYGDFALLAGDPAPRVIEVMGIITFPPVSDGGAANKQQVKVASNKTIVGADGHSGFSGGGLFVDTVRNVIIRNLTISGAFQTDAITIQQSTNVWVDHCDLSCDPNPTLIKMCDGLVDITHASDFVTISWTYYHDHDASGLVGGSDQNGAEDMNHLMVTYHHNLFSNVTSGPRVRFGQVHVYNVAFENLGGYAVGSTCGASVYIERNVFQNVPIPITTMVSVSPQGYVAEGDSSNGNLYVPTTMQTDNTVGTTATSYRPNYAYADPQTDAWDGVVNVQTIVHACTGPGHFDPLPVPTSP